MALIPTWYSASTKQIAEKALQRGVLKYPGLCYIQDSKSIAWVTIDNTLEYVKGDKQITDVKCIGSNLMFFSGDKLLFSYDISMTDEDKGHIIEEVKKTIGLDNYVKSSELSTLLDNIIGNLEDKSTVIDYINSLSYNKLFDVPIVNLIGTLKALADSDLSQYAKAEDLTAAVGRIDALEKKLPTLEAADKKNAEDITAVKGRMDTAEGKITAVEKDLATEKPKIAKNTSDITALKGLVGDGYEAIPSASIKGLFTA